MPSTRPRSPPWSSSAVRGISRRSRHRQRKVCLKTASPGTTFGQFLPPAPPPSFFTQVYQSVHDVFVNLQMCAGATFISAVKKVSNERGASTHFWRSPCSTANHHGHTLSSSRAHARMLKRIRFQITDNVGRWLSVQDARMDFHICIVGY